MSDNLINKYCQESLTLISISKSKMFPSKFIDTIGNFIPEVSIGFNRDEIICKFGLKVNIENLEELIKT